MKANGNKVGSSVSPDTVQFREHGAAEMSPTMLKLQFEELEPVVAPYHVGHPN